MIRDKTENDCQRPLAIIFRFVSYHFIQLSPSLPYFRYNCCYFQSCSCYQVSSSRNTRLRQCLNVEACPRQYFGDRTPIRQGRLALCSDERHRASLTINFHSVESNYIGLVDSFWTRVCDGHGLLSFQWFVGNLLGRSSTESHLFAYGVWILSLDDLFDDHRKVGLHEHDTLGS